jgi:hypothetical protein
MTLVTDHPPTSTHPPAVGYKLKNARVYPAILFFVATCDIFFYITLTRATVFNSTFFKPDNAPLLVVNTSLSNISFAAADIAESLNESSGSATRI